MDSGLVYWHYLQIHRLAVWTQQDQEANRRQLSVDEGERPMLSVEKGRKKMDQREKAERLLRLQQPGSSLHGASSAPELFRLGVVRVSIGSRAMLATMSRVHKIALELHDQGTSQAMSEGVYRWAEAQTWFAAPAQV